MKVNEDNLIETLINKMMSIHNVDFKHVIDNQHIDEVLWCQYYKWTEAQQNEFKAWAIPVIKKALKITLKRAEREYDWFNLMYGLSLIY